MFLVHEAFRCRGAEGLVGPNAEAHQQVSILLNTPFYSVEFTISSGKQRLRRLDLFRALGPVDELRTHPAVSDCVVQIVTPGWINGTDRWEMAELAEVWVGSPLVKRVTGATRYVLRDGRTLLEGKDAGDGKLAWSCVYRV